MTDVVTAADRAVTQPAKALGYGKQAAGQGKAAAKPPAKKPKPTYLDLSKQAVGNLVKAYPALKNVTVREWQYIPNPYVKKNVPGWAAWTNSKNEIYVNDTVTSPAIADAVMQHEALHVDQFGKEGVPSSYLKMATFEHDAYRKSAEYLARRISAKPPDVATYKLYQTEFKKLADKFGTLVKKYAGKDPASVEVDVTADLLSDNDIPPEVMDANWDNILIPAPKLYVP